MADRPIKTRADRVAEYLSRAFSNIRRALGPQAR